MLFSITYAQGGRRILSIERFNRLLREPADLRIRHALYDVQQPLNVQRRVLLQGSGNAVNGDTPDLRLGVGFQLTTPEAVDRMVQLEQASTGVDLTAAMQAVAQASFPSSTSVMAMQVSVRAEPGQPPLPGDITH